MVAQQVTGPANERATAIILHGLPGKLDALITRGDSRHGAAPPLAPRKKPSKLAAPLRLVTAAPSTPQVSPYLGQ